MTVQPHLLVEAPDLTPYKFGLFSVAQPADVTDPHAFLGVEYEPEGAYVDSVTPGTCYQGAPANLAVNTRIPSVHGYPFAVYAAVDATPIGHTEAELIARGQRVLKLGGQHAVERALSAGLGAGITANPVLAQPSTPTIGTGLSVVSGLAACEDYLAQNYNGVGTLHVPRILAPYCADRQQVHERLGQLQTIIGTQFSFGGGYTNTAPDGTAAAADIVWVYLSGVIVVRRGAPFVAAGLAASLNRSTNRAPIFVEQQHVLTMDGPVAAVSIDLTK